MSLLNPFELAVVVLLAALFLLEFCDRDFVQSWYRNRKRLMRNLGFAIASLFVMLLLKKTHGLVRHFSADGLIGWDVWFPFELAACFIVSEFLGWLLHFVKHSNSFLWKFHFQHHRESRYNLWLTSHTHGLEVLVSGVLMALALCLLGFSVMAIEMYLAFYSLMKVFQHSARPYSLGACGRLFITPQYHRLHHEVNSRWNYGVTLTIFDLIFQTAKWPSSDKPRLTLGVSPDQELPYGFWNEMLFFLGRRNTGNARKKRPVAK
jgi:sterol desaturase/sphingolipid hydroxylase (fatty acid hydroxylase superfamily)